jgi:indole-3-glycerol phosphate synthase
MWIHFFWNCEFIPHNHIHNLKKTITYKQQSLAPQMKESDIDTFIIARCKNQAPQAPDMRATRRPWTHSQKNATCQSLQELRVPVFQSRDSII